MKVNTFYKKYNNQGVQDNISETSNEFKKLVKDMRSALKDAGKEHCINLVQFFGGHYFVSGFFEKDGKYIYVSWNCPRGEIPINLDSSGCQYGFLYRTAKGINDFTGGSNHFSDWNHLIDNIHRLIERGV